MSLSFSIPFAFCLSAFRVRSLSRLICDVKDRLTFPQIKAHPWFKVHSLLLTRPHTYFRLYCPPETKLASVLHLPLFRPTILPFPCLAHSHLPNTLFFPVLLHRCNSFCFLVSCLSLYLRFQGLDWDHMREMKASIIPSVTSETGKKWFFPLLPSPLLPLHPPTLSLSHFSLHCGLGVNSIFQHSPFSWGWGLSNRCNAHPLRA